MLGAPEQSFGYLIIEPDSIQANHVHTVAYTDYKNLIEYARNAESKISTHIIDQESCHGTI